MKAFMLTAETSVTHIPNPVPEHQQIILSLQNVIRTKNTDPEIPPKKSVATDHPTLTPIVNKTVPRYIKFPMGHWKVGITRYLEEASKAKIGAKG